MNGFKFSTFRLGSDEFILVLPTYDEKEAEDFTLMVGNDLNEKMQVFGVDWISMHKAIIPYGKEPVTINWVLKDIYLALEKSQNTYEEPSILPDWADKLIDTMIHRTCKTLEQLRTAKALALTDEVSGLPNHRAAEFFLEDRLLRYEHANEPFSLLFVDGDNLKQYNTLNYQRGNLMIRELGAIIVSSVRQGDQVARWLSGDEFMVILPGADRSIAKQVGERLRYNVENITASWAFPVTVSIGVGCCPEDGKTADMLLSRVEEANISAKLGGKNQVY